MVTPSRKRRPQSTTMINSPRALNHDTINRQITVLASCALFLFVMGSLILILKMPDPTSHQNVDDPTTSHNVDTVVKATFGHLKDEQSRRAAARAMERIKLEAKESNHLLEEHHSKENVNEATKDESKHSELDRDEYHAAAAAAFKPKRREDISQSKYEALIANNDSSSPPRLIHVLETRFMQNQPDLVELAKARLHLFSTICLPTVVQQSKWGEFIWVIRTDPDLDEEIKKKLLSLLKRSGALKEVAVDKEGKDKRSLTYVVGSNDNYILANSTTIKDVQPFDIRHMLSNMISSPETVFAGKVSSAQNLLNEFNSKQSSLDHSNDDIILWTRLDADDGLNLSYMEYVQSQAVRYFLPEYYGREILKEIVFEGNNPFPHGERKGNKFEKKENVYTRPNWTYWCAGRNIDWFITDPVHDPIHKNGTVYPVQHINVCVTPGVTVALLGSFNPLEIPRLDHDKIISYLRPQGPKLCSRSGYSVFNETEEEAEKDIDKEEPDDGTCFHMVNAYYFAALRSRTPTSAGMFGVSPNDMQIQIIRRQPILTYAMWMLMVREFGVSRKTLVKTNEYFAKHVFDIAEENARGQCTVGHSCKTSSKDLLQQYADLKNEMMGGFDVVHGVAVKQ